MKVSYLKSLLPLMGLIITTTGTMAADDSDVVLRTNQFVITEQDFDRYLTERNVPESQRGLVLSREGAVRNIFENIYTIKAFAEKGIRNPDINIDEIQWLVEHYRERQLMQRQLALEVDEALANTDWEGLAREEFTAKREDFVVPEQIDVSHILISTQERSKEEAEQRGKEVLARIKAGEDFTELAAEYSDDQGNSESGGNLGYFARGQMVKPFEDAAFLLEEEGDISDLVETDFGYHIIRFVDREPEQQRSFEQVKDQLIASVQERRREQVRSNIIAEVRNGAEDLGLEVDVEKLEAIEAQYAPAEDAESPVMQ